MAKIKYRWFRYRQNWASGMGDWEYNYLPKICFDGYKDYDYDEVLYDYNIVENGNWSDKYRGMDIEFVSPSKVPQIVKKEFLRKGQDEEANAIEQKKYILSLLIK